MSSDGFTHLIAFNSSTGFESTSGSTTPVRKLSLDELSSTKRRKMEKTTASWTDEEELYLVELFIKHLNDSRTPDSERPSIYGSRFAIETYTTIAHNINKRFSKNYTKKNIQYKKENILRNLNTYTMLIRRARNDKWDPERKMFKFDQDEWDRLEDKVGSNLSFYKNRKKNFSSYFRLFQFNEAIHESSRNSSTINSISNLQLDLFQNLNSNSKSISNNTIAKNSASNTDNIMDKIENIQKLENESRNESESESESESENDDKENRIDKTKQSLNIVNTKINELKNKKTELDIETQIDNDNPNENHTNPNDKDTDLQNKNKKKSKTITSSHENCFNPYNNIHFHPHNQSQLNPHLFQNTPTLYQNYNFNSGLSNSHNILNPNDDQLLLPSNYSLLKNNFKISKQRKNDSPKTENPVENYFASIFYDEKKINQITTNLDLIIELGKTKEEKYDIIMEKINDLLKKNVITSKFFYFLINRDYDFLYNYVFLRKKLSNLVLGHYLEQKCKEVYDYKE
ncbi:uncharacterized protein ASCRUDRAFT_70787 [Ascoidea rubescens DSM 1968]|uniref:Myb/SANT-like domain-containing protein n=1 Tax=Ascoidea rubescens DSM 1968 TaxID=1344418 RepID=A0A1D2VEX5_9ASCO|nr:hypothetical protein ASCRUDRAFT_70787 [Ascoidea rubescens DSM 1968]ODV60248.1 hypothetical protein ASCRUDRAFT_70787 [Ascoidea rubescens DSM 1968]